MAKLTIKDQRHLFCLIQIAEKYGLDWSYDSKSKTINGNYGTFHMDQANQLYEREA